MKKKILISTAIFFLVALLLFFFIPRQSTQPDINLNAIRTQAVNTYLASITKVVKNTPKPTRTAIPSPTASDTPTPEVTATLETPAAADPCYSLMWIEDRSIPDGAILKPNETFTKTWLVQNNGGCAWAPGFTFSHFGGDPMRGKPLVLTGPIPVGAKRELSIKMAVPAGTTGLIQGAWRMSDQNGYFFGDTLTVNITVAGPPTATATAAP